MAVDVASLPAPAPRMTEEEAMLVLRSAASQDAELNAQLDEAMAAEQYDLCDELTLKIDQLQQDKAAAQATLGDKAADVTMSTEEAETVVASYADDLAGLEANLGKAMADADYDQCDAVQVEIDALKTKKAAADASLSGGPGPVDNTAVAELKSLSVAEVPQFQLPQIPAFESSASKAQPLESSSAYGDGASGLPGIVDVTSMHDVTGGASMYDSGAGAGASMYDGADAGAPVYDDADAGASMYDDPLAGAGASMSYNDAGAGASMYDTGGVGGTSMYADTAASMYADTGASMYADSAAAATGESMYSAGNAEDTGGGGGGFDFVGTGESMYSAGNAEDTGGGGEGCDFASAAGDTGEESAVATTGFGFIGGADTASASEAAPSGGFGFIGSSDSAAAPSIDAADSGGFSFIAGESADTSAPAGIYGSELAAGGASMYDTAAEEGAANIYGKALPYPFPAF